ncbi:MAG TPA: SRPBCC family protein [Chitinophagaceae bacterium]|nr:SRPBCC family protein [Chitinophagaceae bacterium]
MSIFVIILLIIAAIIVIILVAAAAMPGEYTIQKEVIINKPVQDVFDYVKFSMNQNHYNKWWMMDPNSRKEYVGTDATPGFTMKWDSDNKQAGKGEQEIKKIIDGKRIDYEIRFIKPFRGTSTSFMETGPVPGNQTRVVWAFGGKRNFGMRIFHMLFNLKKMLGKDLQASLNNLKTILEKQ